MQFRVGRWGWGGVAKSGDNLSPLLVRSLYRFSSSFRSANLAQDQQDRRLAAPCAAFGRVLLVRGACIVFARPSNLKGACGVGYADGLAATLDLGASAREGQALTGQAGGLPGMGRTRPAPGAKDPRPLRFRHGATMIGVRSAYRPRTYEIPLPPETRQGDFSLVSSYPATRRRPGRRRRLPRRVTPLWAARTSPCRASAPRSRRSLCPGRCTSPPAGRRCAGHQRRPR